MPQSVSASVSLEDTKAQTHIFWGQRWYQQGRIDDALEAYSHALLTFKQFPTLTNTQATIMAKVHQRIGDILANQQSLEAALTHYRDALKLYAMHGRMSELYPLWDRIGKTYFRQGNAEAGKEALLERHNLGRLLHPALNRDVDRGRMGGPTSNVHVSFMWLSYMLIFALILISLGFFSLSLTALYTAQRH